MNYSINFYKCQYCVVNIKNEHLMKYAHYIISMVGVNRSTVLIQLTLTEEKLSFTNL
nr:MAG TPA: hypothetical protein [Siphoviridae sp. ctEy724]